MIPLVVIAGPTAAGKSEIAVELALRLNGEIVSADSVQVYKHLQIGSAKITPEHQRGVPHHLLDFLEPDADFTVAQFQGLARAKIEDIHARGRLPFLVGGTGLYIQAVIDPYDFPDMDGLEAIRGRLFVDLEAGKGDELYAELQRVDPEAAKRIHPNDHRRITRALEVYCLTGKPISTFQAKGIPTIQHYDLAMAGLTFSRSELYRRIDRRVDKMFLDGLVDEVKQLFDLGFKPDLKPLQTLGYKQVVGYLAGDHDLDVAISLTKKATRNYAKRQLTWFRRDPGIKWFMLQDQAGTGSIVNEIAQFICRSNPVNVE